MAFSNKVIASLFVCVILALLTSEAESQTNGQNIQFQTGSYLTTSGPDVRYALIMKTLGEVTEGRAALQAQIKQYRSTIASLQMKEKSQKDSCVCYNQSTVAFTAHLDKNIATLGKDQPFPFDNVTLNVGNAYDVRHAEFTAPFNGTYQFFVTMATRAGNELVADILLNGTPLVKVRTGNANQVNVGTNGVTVHLTSGDDVWVQHDHTLTDSNRLYYDEGMLTTFSGYLVNKG